MSAHKATIESEEFYDLMQAYRHAPDARQADVVARYAAVIAYIEARLAEYVADAPLRDTFAGLAMQALINNPDAKLFTNSQLALAAYDHADYMLEARLA